MSRQILDYITNPSNPYYLSSNENPTMVLVTSLLTESNYHEWAQSMQTSLLSKNKLQFVDGSLPQPPLGDPMHETWNRCNQMVVSWLRNAMTVTIARSVLWIDLAVDVWNDVRNRFSQGDNFRIAALQEEIFGLKQGDITVSEYFTRLKTFWEELEMLEPLPQCSCVITCDAVTRARTYRTTNYIIRFLQGLNEQYSQVRFQVMLMDPMPSITRVLSLIVQQEDEMARRERQRRRNKRQRWIWGSIKTVISLATVALVYSYLPMYIGSSSAERDLTSSAERDLTPEHDDVAE